MKVNQVKKDLRVKLATLDHVVTPVRALNPAELVYPDHPDPPDFLVSKVTKESKDLMVNLVKEEKREMEDQEDQTDQPVLTENQDHKV